MKALRKVNQETLEKWMEYAKFSAINPYDFELCLKELIGIAKQKELEYKSLEHFFGKNIKETMDDIIQNCNKKNWKDYLLFDLRDNLLILSGYWILYCLIPGAAMNAIGIHSIITILIAFVIPTLYRQILAASKIREKLTLNNFDRNMPLWVLSAAPIILLCLVVNALYWSNTSLRMAVIHSIPNIALPLVCILLWSILTIVRIIYTNRLAEEHPWRDM